MTSHGPPQSQCNLGSGHRESGHSLSRPWDFTGIQKMFSPCCIHFPEHFLANRVLQAGQLGGQVAAVPKTSAPAPSAPTLTPHTTAALGSPDQEVPQVGKLTVCGVLD